MRRGFPSCLPGCGARKGLLKVEHEWGPKAFQVQGVQKGLCQEGRDAAAPGGVPQGIRREGKDFQGEEEADYGDRGEHRGRDHSVRNGTQLHVRMIALDESCPCDVDIARLGDGRTVRPGNVGCKVCSRCNRSCLSHGRLKVLLKGPNVLLVFLGGLQQHALELACTLPVPIQHTQRGHAHALMRTTARFFFSCIVEREMCPQRALMGMDDWHC